MDQMRTDIQLKLADMALKQQQLRWEPLKIVIASAGAGAALMVAATGLVALAFKYFS